MNTANIQCTPPPPPPPPQTKQDPLHIFSTKCSLKKIQDSCLQTSTMEIPIDLHHGVNNVQGCYYWKVWYGSPYLSHRFQAPLKLELCHTLIGWLAHLMTFVHLPLSPATPHTHTVNHIPLLGLVPETTGLVGSGGPGGTVDGFELAELPASDSEKEAKQV